MAHGDFGKALNEACAREESLRKMLVAHEKRIAKLTAQADALTARFDAAIVSAYRVGWATARSGAAPGSDAHILVALKGAK